MGNFSEIQGSKYYQYDFENKGNKWNVMIVWGKFNHVNVTKKTNNPFGSPLGKEFDTLGEAVDNYKDVNIKANILFAGSEAKEFGYNPEYAKGGAIEVGDWVSEIGGKARGQVYKKDGSFIFLKDKYGNEDNTMRFVNKYKHSGKPRYAGGGGVGNKSTFLFTFPKGTNIRNAWAYLKENGVDADFEIYQGVYVTTFDDGSKAVSLLNKSEYKYSNIKQVYAGGGRSKLYMNGREYRAKLNKMTDAELLKYYIDEYGFDPTDKDHAERIENERESVIDELVTEYVDYMKSTGRLYSGGGKTSTNSQVIKKLIKDLDNTPHSVGLALLRERLLSHAEIDLKALEKNPNEWSNPIYSSGMYKDLFTRIIKYLNFESGNGNNDVAVKKLIKNLDNTPYSVGLALLRERLLTYAQNDLKALEKNPKDWSNAFFTSGMYKDLFTRINDHLKFEFKEGGQTIDVTDLGAGDLAFITKTGERVKVLHRIDLIKLAVKNKQGKEFAIYEHQLTPIAKAHKKFAGGGSISDIKMLIRELEREARGLEPGDPDKIKIYTQINRLKMSHPELNRIYAEGGELKKKIVRYPDLDKIQPTMIAKRGAITEQGLFDTYQPVKPTIVSKEPKKKMPGNLTEEISEVDIVRLGVTSLPKGTERKIKSGLDASKILYSVFPKDQIAVQEFYYALFLNNNNDVIAYYNLSKGGVTATIADVELLASVSVKLLAKGVITAHNHPSGNLKPSQADIQMAKKTKDALKLLDITMLDSLIIVPNGDQGDIKYTSLMEEGLM